MSAASSITVRVPITIRQRGGAEVGGDAGWDGGRAATAAGAHRQHVDKGVGPRPPVEADAGRRMLGSVSELAAAEKLDRGYLGKILVLTLLAPNMVEAILDWR